MDVDPQFVSYINLLLSKKYNKRIKSKIALPPGVIELPSSTAHVACTNNNNYAGRYVVDANAPFVDNPVRTLQVDTADQPVLIVLRAGMQHNQHRLYLDTGHWKPPTYPAVINAPNSKVIVEHDLRTGKISYKIKEKT